VLVVAVAQSHERSMEKTLTSALAQFNIWACHRQPLSRVSSSTQLSPQAAVGRDDMNQALSNVLARDNSDVPCPNTTALVVPGRPLACPGDSSGC